MKKYLILVSVCVLIVALAIASRLANSHNPVLVDSKGVSTEKVYATYNINPGGIITLNDSIRFRFDTGSASSSITKDDVRRLQNMGIEVKMNSFPVVARTPNSETLYVSKGKITTDIPFYEMRHVADSLSYGHYESTGKIAGYLRDMSFMPARDKDTISVIGMDMIEHFVVELSEANKAVRLFSSIPDDYQYVMDLERTQTILVMFSDTHRYYLPLSVQNNKSLFRIDTALKMAELKLIAQDSVHVKGRLQSVLLSTPRGEAPAKYAEHVWVKLGTRQGAYSAHYTNEGHDKYAVNPLNFFDQDVLFDFPGQKMYLHPHSNLISFTK